MNAGVGDRRSPADRRTSSKKPAPVQAERQLHAHIHRGAEHPPVGLEPGVTAPFVSHRLDGAEPYAEVVPLAGEVFPVPLPHLSVN